MSSSPSLLRLEQVGRQIQQRMLVRDLSFQVEAGELLCLVGPSGAGKSTLLRLINRLDEPTHGTIWLEGVDTRSLSPVVLRRRVGMVMQRPYLFPGTVAHNVAFGPQQQGETLPASRVDELLAQVQLEGYASRQVDTLSGGEAQRVSLARTLANAPQLLLLDEPTSALDESARAEIERLICDLLRTRGVTSLWVTHDIPQARRVADRVLAMEQGAITRIGSPDEVLDAVAIFS